MVASYVVLVDWKDLYYESLVMALDIVARGSANSFDHTTAFCLSSCFIQANINCTAGEVPLSLTKNFMQAPGPSQTTLVEIRPCEVRYALYLLQLQQPHGPHLD